MNRPIATFLTPTKWTGTCTSLRALRKLSVPPSSWRPLIAFAKTTAAQDLMADSPSEVDPAQLDDLGLAIKPEVKKAAE